MLGRIEFEPGRMKLEREALLELPLCALRLPEKRRGLERRLSKGARRLAAAGVSRVLAPRGFGWWQLLAGHGLRPVDTGALRTALVPQWTREMLCRKGVPPQQATVVLRGARETQAMERSARALCPWVRGLAVDVPGGGALAAALRREFGMPVLPPEAVRPQVVLSFDPEPRLTGVAYALKGADLPAGCDPLPLLSALWENGRIGLDDIVFVPCAEDFP